MSGFISVALGGALGAVARYAISLIPVKMSFPILTLAANLIGAVLIGFIVGIAEGRDGISTETVQFLKVGVCGGFTTFSTFSLEAYEMIDRGSYLEAVAYAVLSVICCIVGVAVGKRLAG